jgi:hypothetical protein
MPHYYVEGLFANKQGVKKKRKAGAYPPNSIEPYAKRIWANSPKEAIQVATSELEGGEWTEGPRVSQITEEQRMRSLGAAEFPGLTRRAKKSQSHEAKGKP